MAWNEYKLTEDFQKADMVKKALLGAHYRDTVIHKNKSYVDSSKAEKVKVDKWFEKELLSETLREGFKNPIANKYLLGTYHEKVAKAIEPESDPNKSLTNAILTEFPRFMAAEYVRFEKPMYKIAAATLGVGLEKAAKSKGGQAVSRFVAKHTPEKVKSFLTVGKGQPKAYQELSEKAELERVAGGREAEVAAKTLATEPFTGRALDLKEQRIVGRIFTGKAEKIRHLPKYSKYSSIAGQGRDIMDKWSKTLAESGIPSDEAVRVIEDNMGKYMGRLYRTKLPKTTFKKRLGLKLNGLKHRKNLSEKVLRELGEIKEPAFPTAIRVKEISTTVANNKLFTEVSKNPQWVSDTAKPGLIKLSDSRTMGPLRDKWVIPSIAEDVKGIDAARTAGQSLYIKSLQAWKYGKVVLNPATHARNMLSNSMLLDLSGVGHRRQAQLMPKVIKDYISRGRNYQLAVKHGAIGGEFYGGEIGKIKDAYMGAGGGNLSKWLNVVKKPFKMAGATYQAEEQVAKLIKFTDLIEKGIAPEIAAKEAQKWLFDYNKIPKIIDLIKKAPIGAPFITFTYKAIPRIAEAIVKNPLKIYKYYALFNSWNTASRKFLKMSPEDYAREQKALPPWQMKAMGGMPSTLLMPWKDKYNRTQWLNLEYILPIGMAPEIMQKGIIKGGVSNPLFNIISDLSKNQDFKGQVIVPIGATKAEATKVVAEYIYRQLVPSLAPSVGTIKGGYSFEKVMDALNKKPDYADRVRSTPQAIIDVLAGLKITSVDVDESEQFRMYDKQKKILDLHKQLRKLEHPAISEKVRNKGVEDIFKKIEKVLEE